MNASSLKRRLIGNPLATSQQKHERLGKAKALAVFSSDALSSVAYATEEIILVLVLAGSGAVHLAWPIALAIAALMAMVAISYFQTIHAYPNGGGAYVVSLENLGRLPGLTAAAALATDYVLTVAVSTSSGVAAITSAFPGLYEERVLIGLAAILLITIANLRGVRESGTIFAIPTYLFVASFLSMLAVGFARWAGQGFPPAQPPQGVPPAVQGLGLFLVLRAFSSGCAALTGIEALSNGVPAFRRPEARNAGRTLTAMAILLVTMFLGITFLTRQFGIVTSEGVHETVVSQLARTVFGTGSPFYYVVQTATALILLLAANTSFNGFPRLSSLVADDGFMPRQFALLGDRLVYSNGIIALGLLSSVLVIVFGGHTSSLIPLYAVGVFLSFSLSQTGMVVHWFRRRGRLWQLKAVVNGLGATATCVVLLVVASTKFIYGAWAVVLFIPILVLGFLATHRHYERVGDELSLARLGPSPRVRRHRVVVPISGVHIGTLRALEYARSISNDVTAVYVEVEPGRAEALREVWDRWGEGVRLVVLHSPFRSIVRPLREYVNTINDVRRHDEVVTIVLSQLVPSRWWANLLHNQTSMLIRLAFLFRSNTIVTDVPFRVEA